MQTLLLVTLLLPSCTPLHCWLFSKMLKEQHAWRQAPLQSGDMAHAGASLRMACRAYSSMDLSAGNSSTSAAAPSRSAPHCR